MTPNDIDRVFGRGRLRMVTGDHVEVFREEALPGERRRYTKRFLATEAGDFRHWTEREWRILARLVGHGIGPVPDVVQYDRGLSGRVAQVQTYDAGITVDHWATLLPVQRDGVLLRHVFEDCAHWWALARHSLIALDAIHEIGLVHLDLKADNVCIPFSPADFDPNAADTSLLPRFEQISLIDFAFSLVSGEQLTRALPIARQSEYDYQSPRLLAALEAGGQGDLAPTRQLDWRCDLFSLAAMLRRYLPDPEAPPAYGWSRAHDSEARALVRRLLQAHDAELPLRRPHAELFTAASLPLADPALAASLERGWRLAPRSNALVALSPTPVTRIALPVEPVPAVAAVAVLPAVPEPAIVGDLREPLDHLAGPPATGGRRAGWLWAAGAVAAAALAVPLLGEAWLGLRERLAAPSEATTIAAVPEAGAAARAVAAPASAAGPATPEPVWVEPAASAAVAVAPAPAGAVEAASASAPSPATEPATVAAPAPATAAASAGAAPLAAAPGGRAAAAPKGRSTLRLGLERSEPVPRPGAPAKATASAKAVAPPQRLPAANPRGVARTSVPRQVAAARPTLPTRPVGVAATRPVAGRPVALAPARPTLPPAPTPVLPPTVAAAPPPAIAAPAPPPVVVAAPAPAPASRDFGARAGDLMANQLPRIAQRAERLVLKVLVAAASDGQDADDEAVRGAARAIRLAPGDPLLEAGSAAAEARALNEAARAAFWRRGDLQEAVGLQTRAFGANPLDAEVAGNLAFLRLKQQPGQPEVARQLALHALTTHDPRHPQGRIEDWTTLAISNALTGRERDARNAWYVTLDLAEQPERQCRAAINAYAAYGDRVRSSVEALLQRAHASGRGDGSALCEWPPHWRGAASARR